MSYFITVFCRSAEAITRAQLAEFILDGEYFESEPTFEPPRGSEVLRAEAWDTLEIRYAAEKRPILVNHEVGDSILRKEVDELAERLEEVREPQAASVLDRARGTRQIFVFDLDEGGLTEEAWEMLSALEAYLARSLDGIILAPNDGIYDADLRLLVSL